MASLYLNHYRSGLPHGNKHMTQPATSLSKSKPKPLPICSHRIISIKHSILPRGSKRTKCDDSKLEGGVRKWRRNKMQVQSRALLLPFLYCCCIGIAHSSIVPGGSDDEISALLSIKASLTDPLDHLKDWKKKPAAYSPSPHCSWTGIVCSPKGLVQKLDLSNMNLTGRVSDDIRILSSLSSIDLSRNGFTSPLPATISDLVSLTSIDLSQNLFDGDFPAGLLRHPLAAVLTSINASGNSFTGFLPGYLGNVSSLLSLDLRGSFFKGPIPKSFKNLKRLKFLGLSGNNLTGELPLELGQLSSLETLILGYNEFSGGLPAELGNLTNLRYLDLAVGNLGGLIPAELGTLKQLHTVFLYKNSFRGNIPASIGNVTSLSTLDLSDNSLSGEIPREMSELANLQLLNLMCNDLTGSIPVGVGNMPRLQVLELWNNTLSGPLPRDLGLHSPLQWLDVSSNELSGYIPAGLCSAGSLTKLILFNNAFSGPIPVNLSACGSLVRARLQNNAISGEIPAGFGGLGKLRRLELASNVISGEIPGDIAASPSLSFIDLSRNRLRSSLPSTVLSIPSLQSFMASGNDLEGSMPDQFQDCPTLSVLDLSSNRLSGVIPASIASCHRLVNLNLGSNQLTGEIPRAIATLPTLAILDLSNNSLTGGIPEGFGESPTLETLDVSSNRLKGPVPASGMLRTINPNELAGNAGLCGGVLPPCSPYPSLRGPKNAKHILVWWLIGVSVVLATGLVAFGARCFYQRVYLNWGCFAFEERISIGNEDWPWRLMAFQRLRFTSSDILACIKESNVIGMGATGVVYKAEMPQLNTVVAVKKLWRSGAADAEAGGSSTNSGAFVWEASLLGRLRHRNIVRLLGTLHNDADVMIVCEFMQNGNLGEALHGKQATGGLLVNWVSRYNVAVGVAHGLAYLHHDCHPPIIHRDIKSRNVLLDADLEARIADFGLARKMTQKNETVSMVAGSYGYIAPEYGYTLKIDEKSDIYSFGVILLELITGRQPLDPEFGEYVNIVEWIQEKVRTSRPLEEALDPSIGETSEHVQEEMLLVLRIALLCTAQLPRDRPSMKDVITMLEGAKPRRKSSSSNGSSSAREDKEMEMPGFSTSPVHSLK